MPREDEKKTPKIQHGHTNCYSGKTFRHFDVVLFNCQLSQTILHQRIMNKCLVVLLLHALACNNHDTCTLFATLGEIGTFTMWNKVTRQGLHFHVHILNSFMILLSFQILQQGGTCLKISAPTCLEINHKVCRQVGKHMQITLLQNAAHQKLGWMCSRII